MGTARRTSEDGKSSCLRRRPLAGIKKGTVVAAGPWRVRVRVWVWVWVCKRRCASSCRRTNTYNLEGPMRGLVPPCRLCRLDGKPPASRSAGPRDTGDGRTNTPATSPSHTHTKTRPRLGPGRERRKRPWRPDEPGGRGQDAYGRGDRPDVRARQARCHEPVPDTQPPEQPGPRRSRILSAGGSTLPPCRDSAPFAQTLTS